MQGDAHPVLGYPWLDREARADHDPLPRQHLMRIADHDGQHPPLFDCGTGAHALGEASADQRFGDNPAFHNKRNLRF
jgi:hypothetical protein